MPEWANDKEQFITNTSTQTLLWSHQSGAWICNSKSHNIVGSNYLSIPWIFWVQGSPKIDKITSFKHSHIAPRRKNHIYMTGMYGYLFHYEINFCIPSVLMWRVSTFHETVHDANMCFCYRASATTMLINNLLTHWGWVTHTCISKLTIIDSDDGLSPGQRQAIIWTNAGIMLIGTSGTVFSDISIENHTFSFKKMHLKMLSAKWQPFCHILNVLSLQTFTIVNTQNCDK